MKLKRNPTHVHRTLPALLLLLPIGCGSSTTGTELTLDNCETSIASDAPAFFQLFKCVTVTSDSSNITVATINLPPHKTYYYGEDSANYTDFDGSTPGAGNPFTIAQQDISITVPVDPVSRGLTINGDLVDGMAGTSEYEYPGGTGIALDGTSVFSGTARAGDALEQEAVSFDSYLGHPEDQGNYHYHGASKGPLEVLQQAGKVTSTTPGSASLEIYGIMCDGTVLLGCTEADGSKPSSSDLDAQGGHVTDIKDSSGAVYFSSRYHTHVCTTGAGYKYSPEIQYYDSCVTQS